MIMMTIIITILKLIIIVIIILIITIITIIATSTNGNKSHILKKCQIGFRVWLKPDSEPD